MSKSHFSDPSPSNSRRVTFATNELDASAGPSTSHQPHEVFPKLTRVASPAESVSTDMITHAPQSPRIPSPPPEGPISFYKPTPITGANPTDPSLTPRPIMHRRVNRNTWNKEYKAHIQDLPQALTNIPDALLVPYGLPELRTPGNTMPSVLLEPLHMGKEGDMLLKINYQHGKEIRRVHLKISGDARKYQMWTAIHVRIEAYQALRRFKKGELAASGTVGRGFDDEVNLPRPTEEEVVQEKAAIARADHRVRYGSPF